MANIEDWLYKVKYRRTADWWQGWFNQMATWTDERIGVNNWEYVNESFVFKKEEDAVMFKLMWGTNP